MGYMASAGYTPRTYFTISKLGEIKQSVKTEDGTYKHVTHAAYEGRIVAIARVRNKFEEEQWNVTFENETGGHDIWQTSVNSKTFALFLSAICSATPPVNTVTLAPYLNGQYVNLNVLVNGQRTRWKYGPKDFPAAEEIRNKAGELVSRDYTDRNTWIENTLLPEACAVLGVTPTNQTAPAATHESAGVTPF